MTFPLNGLISGMGFRNSWLKAKILELISTEFSATVGFGGASSDTTVLAILKALRCTIVGFPIRCLWS